MAKAPSTKLTAGDVQDLAVAVEQLTEETRLLRMSLDELRDDVVWAARQALAVGESLAPGQLRRQYDPLAVDTAPPAKTVTSPAEQDGESESEPYCCAEPNLQWHGDPEAPGIACANCGYLVAEMGSIVIWRGESNESEVAPPQEQPQRQGTLF